MTITNISADILEQLQAENPNLQIIDVRTPQEFDALGHIPQALLLPLAELPQRFKELDPTQPTLIVCQHGVRSLHACCFLEDQGFQKLYNLQDGMVSWDSSH